MARPACGAWKTGLVGCNASGCWLLAVDFPLRKRGICAVVWASADDIVVHTSLPPAKVHASLPPANVQRKYPDSGSSLCACSELVRYRQFLGIQKEQQNIKEEQEKLKNSFAAGKDIVSPDNLNTISQAKAEGTPADRYPERQLSGSLGHVYMQDSLTGAPVTASCTGCDKVQKPSDVPAWIPWRCLLCRALC